MSKLKKESLNSTKSNLIWIIFFFPIINFYIGQILELYGLSNMSILFLPAVYLSSLYLYLTNLRTSPLLFFYSIIISFLIFIGNYLMFPSTIKFMFGDNLLSSNVMYFFVYCLPIFTALIDIGSIEKFFRKAIKPSIIILILALLSFILRVFILKVRLSDYMTYAYSAMIPTMVLAYFGYKDNKMSNKALSILGVMFILMGGSRGATLTILVYIFLFMTHFWKPKSKLQMLTFVNTLFLVVVAALNYQFILEVFNSFLSSVGYENRVFGTISESSFFVSTGRNDIIQDISPHLSVFPRGLYSDFLYSGSYAHNWVLEITLNFGVIIGTFLNIIIVCLLSINYFKSLHNKEELMLLTMMSISIYFVKLFLSASYLSSIEFWMILGLLIASTKVKKYHNEPKKGLV